MLIEAYFDESGIHDGAKVCVVGGFYGSQPGWRKFEAQWNKIISEYPELAEAGFHAKRFFARPRGARVSPYRDWLNEKADKFLNRLVQCVVRNSIFPIGYGIVVKDFLALPLLDRKWFTGAKFNIAGEALTSGCPNKSYYVPFQWCVLESSKVWGKNKIEKVHFFAGLDRSFYGYATVLHGHLLKDVRLPASLLGKLGGISYPLAKNTPGIQAADLFVNRLYQHASAMVVDRGKAPPIPALLKSLAKNRREGQQFSLFDAKGLSRIQDYGRQSFSLLVQKGEIDTYLSRLRST